jgi:glutamate-1-semialdehyde 2,1-aminomutase
MSHPMSMRLYNRSNRVVGGGDPIDQEPCWGGFPLFFKCGKGTRIWDADGNEYIDYLLGGGPLIFGHCYPPILEAIFTQLEKGIVFGAQSEIDILVAEKIHDLVPCADLVRMASTGSEVVHAALRLARAKTGRPKIIRFEGHYHGWLDNIAWDSGHAESTSSDGPAHSLHPTGKGQQPEDSANLIVLPWNNLQRVADEFKQHGDQIAGVITEPVMASAGIPPLPGFLQGLRDLCDQWGAALVFDEVVTGFRWALGGAQEYYGVVPDLATFSKCLGGGVPVSALAGRKEWMGGWYELGLILAGTFNCNPLSMAGTLATLEALSENHGERLRYCHTMADTLAGKLQELARSSSLPLVVRPFPGCLHVAFIPDAEAEIINARSLHHIDFSLTQRLSLELLKRGVRVAPSGGWGVTCVHSREDTEETLRATEEALAAFEGRSH